MIKIFLFALFVNAVFLFAVESKNNTLKRLGDSEYYISSEAITFVQAWAYCQDYGKNIVSFATADEIADLIEIFDNMGLSKPNNFWIGGIYIQSGLISKWYWVNGNRFSYTNWYNSTISTTYDNCIRLDYTRTTNGKWISTNCVVKFKFICS